MGGLREDEGRWQTWHHDIDRGLPQDDAVARSLLTLRLLTYSVGARPSLPRPRRRANWDYRYVWLLACLSRVACVVMVTRPRALRRSDPPQDRGDDDADAPANEDVARIMATATDE